MDQSTRSLTSGKVDAGPPTTTLGPRAMPTDALAVRFAERLQRTLVGAAGKAPLGNPLTKASAPASQRPGVAVATLMGRSVARGQLRQREDDDRSERTAEAGASAILPTALAGAAATAEPVALATMPAETAAMLEKIAAAIAEVQQKGSDALVRIDFTGGSPTNPAGGAVIARDAQTGAFSIRLVGLINGVGQAERTVLEADLRRGLGRRRLRVDELRWDETLPVRPDGIIARADAR